MEEKKIEVSVAYFLALSIPGIPFNVAFKFKVHNRNKSPWLRIVRKHDRKKNANFGLSVVSTYDGHVVDLWDGMMANIYTHVHIILEFMFMKFE